MIYFCPGKNPQHEAFRLKNIEECKLDYEHNISVIYGDGTFGCNNSYHCVSPLNKINGHHCHTKDDYFFGYTNYGTSIVKCVEDQYGRLWAGNSGEITMVKY